jgi:hypothetical protein
MGGSGSNLGPSTARPATGSDARRRTGQNRDCQRRGNHAPASAPRSGRDLTGALSVAQPWHCDHMPRARPESKAIISIGGMTLYLERPVWASPQPWVVEPYVEAATSPRRRSEGESSAHRLLQVGRCGRARGRGVLALAGILGGAVSALEVPGYGLIIIGLAYLVVTPLVARFLTHGLTAARVRIESDHGTPVCAEESLA